MFLILSDNWKTLLFIKVYPYTDIFLIVMLLFFFLKSVFFLTDEFFSLQMTFFLINSEHPGKHAFLQWDLLYFNHSHIIRETRTVLLIFYLELEISVVDVQRIHQNSKRWWVLIRVSYWNWLLDTFCCYEYGANATEAVQKIATD